MPGKFVWNDIVKNGKFITPYTQKFITDRDQLRDAVREAKDKYGRFSIEYYKARLNRDNGMLITLIWRLFQNIILLKIN